jgi:YD repeat-containing protein
VVAHRALAQAARRTASGRAPEPGLAQRGPTTAPSGTGTSYVYDTDGNILAADSPGSATVYVFGEQITAATSGGPPPGSPACGSSRCPAARRSSYCFETSDLHGTSVITINSSLANPVWR